MQLKFRQPKADPSILTDMDTNLRKIDEKKKQLKFSMWFHVDECLHIVAKITTFDTPKMWLNWFWNLYLIPLGNKMKFSLNSVQPLSKFYQRKDLFFSFLH